MKRELYDNFIKEVKKQNLNVLYSQIIEDGKLIGEYKKLENKTRLNVMSIAKSVIGCATGIAIDEGLIALDEKVVDIFPEYVHENMDPIINDIEVINLLTMTSGLEKPLFFNDSPERYICQDWIKYFFDAKFSNTPGSTWLYSNFNTYILSCAIEKRAGVNLLEYLRYRFFEPLDIGNPDWTMCPKHHVYAANGLYLTIDELSRLGQLFCNYGSYNGKQIVPREYMIQAGRKQADNSYRQSSERIYRGHGYGYQFHINPSGKGYHAAGKYGQLAVALPDEKTVITVISLEDNYGKIGNTLWKEVIEKIEK